MNFFGQAAGSSDQKSEPLNHILVLPSSKTWHLAWHPDAAPRESKSSGFCSDGDVLPICHASVLPNQGQSSGDEQEKSLSIVSYNLKNGRGISLDY